MSIVDKAWNHYEALAAVAAIHGRMSDGDTIQTALKTVDGQIQRSECVAEGFDKFLEPNFKLGGSNSPTGEDTFFIPSLNIQLCTMIDYKRWGRQNVVIGPQMQEAFADTELGKVPTNHLKFPFPAYWISIPENEKIVCWGGSPMEKMGMPDIYGTGWHEVRGAYVIAREGGLLVHMWAPDPADPTIRQRVREKFGVANTRADEDWGHTWFSFQFDQNKDIEEALRDQFGNKRNEIHDPNPLNPEKNYWSDDMSIHRSDEVSSRVMESSVRMLRIVINSALYMTSPKADMTKLGDDKQAKLNAEAQDLEDLARRTNGRGARGLRRQAERKRKKAEKARPPVIWIGPNIERMIREAKASSGRRSESKRKGHVRKGHWHMFRTGRMKDDAGMKIPNEQRQFVYHWIPPTWCGDLDTRHTSQTHAFREI